ncbi:thioredoxin-like protein [Tirmania nivea]|nr:thioredoxin-like protein [Tirmania nivea]
MNLILSPQTPPTTTTPTTTTPSPPPPPPHHHHPHHHHTITTQHPPSPQPATAVMAARYAFAPALKELRFHFCQTGAASTPLRSFLRKSYPVMKKHNSNTPILMREALGIEPRVFARYELGKEVAQPLTGLSEKEIEEKVAVLAKGRA